MASFNKVILMGNLARDPEMRQSQSGTPIATTALAVNDRIPDGSGGYREETSFVNIVIFGKQAESFGKWFQKGRPCLVEGKLRESRWEDKESGKPRTKIEVIVDRWHFAGGRGENEGGGGGGYGGGQRQPARQSNDPVAQADAGFPSADEFVPDDVPF
ncbi:MAG TPA: single-stranded DNA-binding protein [Planctomycetota bacterium]